MIGGWSCRRRPGQVTTLPSQPSIWLRKHRGLSPGSDFDAPFARRAEDDGKWTGGPASAGVRLWMPKRIWPSEHPYLLSFPMGGRIFAPCTEGRVRQTLPVIE